MTLIQLHFEEHRPIERERERERERNIFAWQKMFSLFFSREMYLLQLYCWSERAVKKEMAKRACDSFFFKIRCRFRIYIFLVGASKGKKLIGWPKLIAGRIKTRRRFRTNDRREITAPVEIYDGKCEGAKFHRSTPDNAEKVCRRLFICVFCSHGL